MWKIRKKLSPIPPKNGVLTHHSFLFNFSFIYQTNINSLIHSFKIYSHITKWFLRILVGVLIAEHKAIRQTHSLPSWGQRFDWESKSVSTAIFGRWYSPGPTQKNPVVSERRHVLGHSVISDCDPVDCSPPGSSVHGDSPGKNTGVGCHGLLQDIFPTQVSNPDLLPCRWILYHLSHQGSPRK